MSNLTDKEEEELVALDKELSSTFLTNARKQARYNYLLALKLAKPIRDTSLGAYLADTKEHYDTYKIETYGTRYETALGIQADYKEWVSDREVWLKDLAL